LSQHGARAVAHPPPGARAQELPADVRAEASRCAKSEDVPWLLLRRVCRALREAHTAAGSDASTPPPPGACTPRALQRSSLTQLLHARTHAEPWLQTLARSGGLRLVAPQWCAHVCEPTPAR
jgi:hypothetical protein